MEEKQRSVWLDISTHRNFDSLSNTTVVVDMFMVGYPHRLHVLGSEKIGRLKYVARMRKMEGVVIRT